jgi:predicted SPOUT superfamily RNA methylase MTH1
MLNRLHNFPLHENRNIKMNTITQIAKQNGYPITLRNRLNQIKNKINRSKNYTLTQNTNNNKKWITFEYSSPLIRKVTNMFKNTNLKITFHVSNTTQNILKTHTQNNDEYKKSGIYNLKCNTCNKLVRLEES